MKILKKIKEIIPEDETRELSSQDFIDQQRSMREKEKNGEDIQKEGKVLSFLDSNVSAMNATESLCEERMREIRKWIQDFRKKMKKTLHRE